MIKNNMDTETISLKTRKLYCIPENRTVHDFHLTLLLGQ
jgi:hypothetical protein